ncbi:MAG: NAD(+) diphosphatase [Phyllobacteriaceae bacterium]|nr:NAD(+) diphosphatase [Phyllobacteriaceae bacterium]
MNFSLFSAPPEEPSRRVGFAGNRIDRQSEMRNDDSATQALADPAARLLVLGGGRAFLKTGDGVVDPWWTAGESAALRPNFGAAVLLGWLGGGPVLAASAGVDAEAAPAGVKAIDLRSIHVQELVDPEALGALAQAASLLAWHAANGFCGRCSGTTSIRGGGIKRHCPACDSELFPRTDPVAIMLAVRENHCLLGRGRHFPPGMHSCLAGFIEPGETIEDAVRRETFEESGVRIGRVAYHASQPWPFPHSLMVGCFAEALSQDIRRDEAELEDCRWFSRQETRAMLDGAHQGGLFLPPNGAIATHLVRAWAEAD